MKKLYFLLLLFTNLIFAQPPIINPSPYELCDGNNDSFEMFDLTSKNAEILGSLSPSLYTVGYYANYQDMTANTNPLSSPYQNTTSGHQSIYVKVVENANVSNFATTILNLRVNYYPSLPSPVPYQAVYESPNDGVAVFNLSSYITFLLSGQQTISVTYYLTQADAQAQLSPIVLPSSYTGTDMQTIWVRLTNTITGCLNITSFQLRVLDSATVINISDYKFRNKLLSSSSANTIAKDNAGNYVAIDANNDGAIQFTEALPIVELNLSYNNGGTQFNSLDGIQSFSNLTSLDFSYNSVSTLYETSLTNLTKLNFAGNNLTAINLPVLPNLTELDCSSNQLSSLNLINSGNLQRLICRFNNTIQTLNLNYVPNLLSLDCSGNQIQNLNLSFVPNIQFLACNNNLLTSLDVEHIPNALGIQCVGNSISNLNLSNSPNLSLLYCNNNLLTSLDLSNLPNLATVQGGHNPLTSLLLGSFPSINNFDFQYTSLTDIDASMIHSIGNYQFTLSNNPNLISANLKSYNFFGYYWLLNCPNLTYLCCRDESITYYQGLANGIMNLPNLTVNTYCSFNPGGNYNTITGTMTFDADNNGCDAADDLQPNIRVNINDGTNTGASFTSSSGNYTFYTQTGSFAVTPAIENLAWFNLSPATATIPFANNNNNIATQNFCIAANGVHPDIEIVIAPIIPARPGFDAVYKIVYKNKGNQTMSQQYGIIFSFNNNLMSYVSSSDATSSAGFGTLTWDYANLLPFESRSILVTMHVNSPVDANPVNIGDVLTLTAIVLPQAGDENVSDNTFQYNQSVVGSFDPNDVTCIEGNLVSPIEIGDYLHYIINFENTGTADAENIVVKDVIDTTQFDVNSLQILNSSSPITAKITGNVAEFIFPNINLHSGGHGNILIKVKSKNTLIQGDTVSKQANIYFDYNAPVETNLENTTFQTLSNSNHDLDASITVYPNPTKGNVNINCNNTIESVQLYDAQGRLLETDLINQTNTVIDISSKSNGVYFLKVLSDKGILVQKIVKN